MASENGIHETPEADKSSGSYWGRNPVQAIRQAADEKNRNPLTPGVPTLIPETGKVTGLLTDPFRLQPGRKMVTPRPLVTYGH
jgi:hypothetical protein